MAETAVTEQLDQLREELTVHGPNTDAAVDGQAPKAAAKPKRPRRRKAAMAAAKTKAEPVADVATIGEEAFTPETIVERLEQEARRNPILTAAAMLGLGLALGRLLSR